VNETKEDMMSIRYRKANFRRIAALVLAIVLSGSAHAQTQPPAVQHGITWLSGQVQANGSLAGEGASIATTLQAREETLVTLRAIATTPAALATAISTNADRNTEYTARRIAAATAAGQPNGADVAALIALQNADGGWGLSPGYQSDALDTAFALQALRGANTSSTVAGNGLAYLAQAKSSDGGWGVSDQSSVYFTANVLLASNAWSSQSQSSPIAASATTWLLGVRSAAQDYGDSFDNAYALLALATQPGQSAALPPLVAALDAAQSSDGSWADDPYVTALALHALWYASAPPTTVDSGDVLGTVVDQASGQPLAGASVALAENAGFGVTTGSDGGFRLSGIPAGTYTLQVSKSGYQSRALSIQVVAAQNTNVGSIALAPVATSASLSGVIKNNSGQPLQNVIVSVGSKSTLTDANGAYQLGGISPGAATINASLTGYNPATASVTFVAGTSYLFSPTLYPTNVTPPPTSLQGVIVDATTRQPIAGASVVFAAATQLTDASGKFVFTNIATGAFTATVSATGYQGVVVSGSLVAGLNDIGTIALQTAQTATSLQGKVLDAQGRPINNATVAISGGPSATSDVTGAYQLGGLVGTTFTLQVSATGYVTQAFAFTVSAPGAYTQDFQLVAQQTNAVTLGPLTVAPASAGANANLSVSTTLINGGSTPFDGVLLLEVRDASDTLIGSGPLTDTAGLSIGAVSLQPGDHLGVIGRWNTGTFAPAGYRFEVRVVQPGSITRSTPLGTLIVNQFAPFAIVPTTHFTGTVAGDPPVIQAGVNQAVHLTAVIKNDGNVALPAQPMNLTVADSTSGAIAFTASANISQQVPNGLAALDFGGWTPATGGNYKLTVTAADPALGKVIGNQYVGNVAQAEFTATPGTVLAGTRTVHGNIHVTGVNPAQATITDPLAPLIRTAIQKAVAFNDPAAHTWIDANRCSSCHIGNQALIGGELTRQLSTYNEFDRTAILNNISTNQATDGGIWQGYYGYYTHRLGTLSLWGLLGYHNLQEFSTVIKRAGDWVVGFQAANGEWQSDWNGAWFDDDISMSMLNISNLHHIDDFLRTNAVTSVPTYATQTLLASQPASSRGSLIASSSGNLYYVDQSGAAVYLIKPDGSLVANWTGFSDPRSIVERSNGEVWLSTAGSVYRLNVDGTKTALPSSGFDTLSVGSDGTVWGTVWGNRSLYKFDDTGTATVWLSNGPFSQPSSITVNDDGSLYVPDYYNGRIYRVLPDKSVTVAVEMMQGAGAPPGLLYLFKDGDHWLLSTTNGIYRFSSAWEGQRITWSQANQMARLADGTLLYVVTGQRGINKLLLQNEPVAASLTRYENALSLGTTWLQSQSIAANDNLHMAQQLWGLGEAYRYYETLDTARAATIRTAMTTLATRLRANQNADGGWGRYTSYGSDALVTAQTGLALDYTNPSAGDPAIRKAVAWLLTQQQADGSWTSANGIMSTHESTTTMVAIWLPTILDRLGSIDAQVSATFPPNVQPSNFVPTPDHSTTDAAGNLVVNWALTGVTDSGRDLGFDLSLVNMRPDEVRPVATDAHMTFNNSFTQQIVTVPIAVPSVTADSTVALTVVTDHPDYPSNATAQVTTTLVNADGVPVNGTLVVNVYDAAGAFVGSVTQQDVTIPPGGSLPVTGPFAIGTITPAQYTVKAVLGDNGRVLAQGQTTFNVLPDNASALATSTVHTDRQTYNPSDRVQILSHVQSQSVNALLSNLTLTVKVYDAADVLQFTHAYPIAQLLAGQGLDFGVPEQLSNAAPGIYTVRQDLLDAQAHLLSHVETAYNVSSTSDTGFGLVGTISATPKILPIGGRLALDASATNQGNSALTNVPLTITIVDPDTGNALQRFDQVSSLAVGGSVPFDSTWVTQGRVGTTYFAVLGATVGSGANAHAITLAVDTFQLVLSLDADVTLTAAPPPLAALVLVDATTPSAETARVSNALSALNYVATFVTTPTDFATSVRSGAYRLYLLLATQVAPDATTLRLLREGVHRGEGLIAANGVAELPDALAQVTGLSSSGALPVINARALDVLAGAPGGAAHTTFTPSLASRIVVAQSAQTQATLTGRLPGVPDEGRLSDELASHGRVDIGYYGTDAGTNSTHLALSALGRIRAADGSDRYSVWRIRNSADGARNVILASVTGGYSSTLSVAGHTDTFIASPIVAGTADHRLLENTQVIQTVAEPTSVFTDTRLVDVGDNPGAIALWANSAVVSGYGLEWTGSQHTSYGAVHSNSGMRWSGAQNLVDGPVHYVTSFVNTGSQNTFTLTPRAVSVQPLPQLVNLDDYRPGGPVQAAVGSAYLDQSAECAKNHRWQRNGSRITLASGVYWIPCDVQLAGSSFSGTVTLVSTGSIQFSGSSATFQAFHQGLQFATSLQSADAVKLASSSMTLGGYVFAPNGGIEASGSNSLFNCSLIGDTIRMAGAKITIDPRNCAYAPIERRTPAVLRNAFGAGRAAYAAFDWQAAIGAYEPTSGVLRTLFAGVLADIAPTDNSLRAGSVVPLTSTVLNKADPFTGQLVLQANDDSTFIPSAPSWLLDFSRQNSFAAHASIRLGAGTSTDVKAVVSASTPIVIDALKRATLTIPHLSGESVGDLITAVSAIGNRDAALSNALVALQAAQAAITAHDHEGAVQHLLDAAEACGQSTNAQADALRTRVDWVVWATAH
jgi:hypothetical protein